MRLHRIFRWAQLRARFRSTFLFIIGITELPYGIALWLGSVAKQPLHWWPGYASEVLGLPLTFWAWAWMIVGTFLLATCWLHNDRLQFALAVALNVAWAGAVIQHAITGPSESGAWGPASIYSGIAAGIFMISAWPDPVPPPNGPLGPFKEEEE